MPTCYSTADHWPHKPVKMEFEVELDYGDKRYICPECGRDVAVWGGKSD